MSVTEILRPDLLLHGNEPVQDDAPLEPNPWVDAAVPDDVQFAAMLKQGVLFGVPAVYLVLVAVALLAVPAQPGLLLAMIGPAVVAGWYFGAMVALTVFELEHQPKAVRQSHRRLGGHFAGLGRARAAH